MKSFKELNELRDEIDSDDVMMSISEASMDRIFNKINVEKKDYVMLTAYRNQYSKKENIKRNRDLRGAFNKKKMGAYSFIGHWQECQAVDENGKAVSWDRCPIDKLVDVVERSYMVLRPDDMDTEEFIDMSFKLGKKYDQDAILLRAGKYNGAYGSSNKSQFTKFKDGDLSMKVFAQAWSAFVKNGSSNRIKDKEGKKTTKPYFSVAESNFRFLGIESPECTSIAKTGLYNQGFRWI
jgi:hypothetical protein